MYPDTSTFAAAGGINRSAEDRVLRRGLGCPQKPPPSPPQAARKKAD